MVNAGKARLILREFYGPLLLTIIPLNYADPGNVGVVCECNFYRGHTEFLEHAPDCIFVGLARALEEVLHLP